MKTFILIHHHRFGDGHYLFHAEKFPKNYKRLNKKLNLNYEPNREDEWLEITEVDLSEIPTI